jgi:hypothetical protein
MILEIYRCFGDHLALGFFPQVNFHKTTHHHIQNAVFTVCPENPKHHETILISVAVYSPVQ